MIDPPAYPDASQGLRSPGPGGLPAAEAGFDDAVLLAREILTRGLGAAPVALLALRDGDRLRFVARLGSDAEEADPADPLWALALSQPGLTAVRDLAADPRTRGEARVAGAPALLSYAGLRLDTLEGAALGLLCVLDTRLRDADPTPGEAAALRAVGRQVTGLLDARAATGRRDTRERATVRLGESALLMRLAIEATGIGVWDYDPVADRLDCDAATRALLALDASRSVRPAKSFLRAIHAGDRARAGADLRASLDPAGDGGLDGEYRVGPPGEPARWVAVRGRPVVSGGRATRIVGSVRDVTARKQADLAFAAVRERYRLIARAANDAIRDWDLVADTVTWNETLRTAYGWDPAGSAATGAWWLGQIHPDDRGRIAAALRAVIADGAESWSLDYRFLRADGLHADVLDRGYVIRSPDGTPARLVGAMLDLTERNRAEAGFRAIFEGANVGIVQLDPRTLKALSVNAKLCAIWGAPAEAIVGHPVAQWTPPEDAAERDALHARLAGGEILRETLEKRYRRADGRIIWGRVNLVSQRLGDRLQATAMIEDITQERRTEERHRALIALDDGLRDASGRGAVLAAAAGILGSTLGASRAGYGAVDYGAGAFVIEESWTAPDPKAPARPLPSACRLAAFAETMAGLRSGLPQAPVDIAADPALAGDAAAYAGIGARAAINVPLIRLGRLAGVLFVHEAAPRAWSAGEIAFAREVAERVWGALGRIQAEDQQTLRNRELSHRLKNTLAMVQAIASQTLRNAPDFESAKEALAARLIALGKAHDILLTGARESAAIGAVIAGALAIHDDGQPGRLALDGPAIEVGPKAALSLALMLHELATNAVKYGALSVPDGRISVSWAIEAADGPEPMVRMVWTEAGGPPVALPSRRGFGSRLIERGLSGAVGGLVALDYAPDGVVCRVAAPLSGFQAAE